MLAVILFRLPPVIYSLWERTLDKSPDFSNVGAYKMTTDVREALAFKASASRILAYISLMGFVEQLKYLKPKKMCYNYLWNGHNVNKIYALCRGIQDDDGCTEIAGLKGQRFLFIASLHLVQCS